MCVYTSIAINPTTIVPNVQMHLQCQLKTSQTVILSIWQALAAVLCLNTTILYSQLMQVRNRKVVLQNYATLATAVAHKALHQQDKVTILNAINTPDYDIS